MFEKGEYVVNSNNGICEIVDVIAMDMGAGNKEYYVLIPIDEKTAKIYLPVDIAEKRIRLDEGKKTTVLDERYFKLAENQLYGELAFALGVQKSEISQMIEQNIE